MRKLWPYLFAGILVVGGSACAAPTEPAPTALPAVAATAAWPTATAANTAVPATATFMPTPLPAVRPASDAGYSLSDSGRKEALTAPQPAGDPRPPGVQIEPIGQPLPCLLPQPHPTLTTLQRAAYPDSVPDAILLELFPYEISGYLNMGATAIELAHELERQSIAGPAPAVAEADLTGDGRLDLVVSIDDDSEEGLSQPGFMALYVCRAGAYEPRLIVFRASDADQGAPALRQVYDLNGDGTAEVLAGVVSCGAHTCFETLHLWGWNGNAFEDWMGTDTSSMPYPTTQIEDADGDGLYDLLVTGHGYGSVGAGPQREEVLWLSRQEDGLWSMSGYELSPSNYRIHVLHDADLAFADGDLDTAEEAYLRVLQDETLDNLSFAIGVDEEELWEALKNFARFKLLAIFVVEERTANANETREDLHYFAQEASWPAVYADLGDAFEEAFVWGGGAAGCQAVREMVESDPNRYLSAFAHFGYGNPEYTAEEVCPWTE